MNLNDKISRLDGGDYIEISESKLKGIKILILVKNDNNTFHIYQPDTKEIIYNYEIKNDFILLASILDLDEYVWMGIEVGYHKILINLISLTVEYYNPSINIDWEYLDSNFIIEETDDLLLISFPDVMIKINLDTLTCKILDSTTSKFKNYHNYLLGKNEEYVFNEFGELELNKE